MPGDLTAPTYDGVLAELLVVREHGLTKLRRLTLPHLHAAAQLTDLTLSEEPEPAAIEQLIRQAVETLGGGTDGDVAEATYGLVAGTKSSPAPQRRRTAAQVLNLSVDRFRKAYERDVIDQVAEGVIALCHDASLRQTRRNMEQRHPADSRLAVQWVERFEAYYRIWTPIYALAANLEAALRTYREEPADHLPWDPNSVEPYDSAAQAQGYAQYALYAYTQYLLELKKFKTKHGGLWLLSDIEVEQQVADAIYRIGWHNPLNEEDDSWLRRFLADARHEEPQHFAAMLKATQPGAATLIEWQEYVASCECGQVERGQGGCQVHAAILAGREYCDLIDHDWLKVADWYRPGVSPSRGLSGNQLYESLLDASVPPTISSKRNPTIAP